MTTDLVYIGDGYSGTFAVEIKHSDREDIIFVSHLQPCWPMVYANLHKLEETVYQLYTTSIMMPDISLESTLDLQISGCRGMIIEPPPSIYSFEPVLSWGDLRPAPTRQAQPWEMTTKADRRRMLKGKRR